MLRKALSHPLVFAVTQALVGVHGGRDVLFREWIRMGRGARVLDVGCGIGTVSRHLRDDVRYVGADLEWRYLRHAADRYGPDATFVRCDVTRSWPFRESGFDCVFGFGLLHHLSDDQASFVLSEARRLLKRGGVLYTVDPFTAEGQGWITRSLLALDRGEYIRRSAQYHRLAASAFTHVTQFTRSDLLRLPYDVLMMRCQP
jgi:ubiquinone/menaquinone biosynthesis C-methylase UbiE